MRPEAGERKADFADAKGPLEAWYAEAVAAKWLTPAQIKDQYRNASILRNSRVVFNIGGNRYRLVVKIHYKADPGIVFVRFVGTHGIRQDRRRDVLRRKKMQIRPIKSEQDYEAALKRIESLMGSDKEAAINEARSGSTFSGATDSWGDSCWLDLEPVAQSWEAKGETLPSHCLRARCFPAGSRV